VNINNLEYQNRYTEVVKTILNLRLNNLYLKREKEIIRGIS